MFLYIPVIFTGSVKPPNSGKAAVYMRSTNESIHYEWSHDSPDTVLHYNAMTYINGALTSTVTLPSGTFKDYSTVSQGKLRLEIEAVDLCGNTATHTIEEDAIKC